MPSVAKVGKPSLVTAVPPTSCNLSGLHAGEAIAAGDACYIKSADGLVYRSNGTVASDPSNVVDGFASSDCPLGGAISLYYGVRFAYGAGMTPGTFLYLDTVPGGLNTAPTAGGVAPIARVVPDYVNSTVGSRIEVKRSWA